MYPRLRTNYSLQTKKKIQNYLILIVNRRLTCIFLEVKTLTITIQKTGNNRCGITLAAF